MKLIKIISLIVIVISASAIYILMRPTYEPEKSEKNEITPVIDTNVKIAVLNGCGRKGILAFFVNELRNKGFDVVNGLGGNADSFEYENTIVVDRKGDILKAKSVANFMGIDYILSQITDDPYIIEDVWVIVGKDWDRIMKKMEVRTVERKN